MTIAPPIDKDILRRFSRLEDLSNQELDALSSSIHYGEAPKRAELIALGSDDDNTLYLVEGTVRLEAADGVTKEIRHDDPAARHPISRLRPSRHRVVAVTKVRFLSVANDQLDSVLSIEVPSRLMSQYKVSELLENDSDLSANYLLQIYKDLSQDAPIVPSWFKVSSKVVHRILQEKQDKGQILKYLMLDPVLAVKAMHRALLLTRYKPEVKTCRDALAHLDMSIVQKLAFMSLFEESINPDSPVLLKACREWWEKSICVSAVARILARQSGRFDPDYLALGGLLHAIGEAIIIGYAHRFPEFVESGELNDFILASSSEVGRVLLTLWKFPHQFVEITADATNWHRDDNTEADEVDIILVARALVGNALHDGSAPDPETLPAYSRLRLAESPDEDILELIHAAQFASNEAIKLLARQQDG